METSYSYAPNCSMLFTEVPLLERPQAAKDTGFDAIESWWPFEAPVPGDREADAFVRAVEAAGVQLVSLNFFAGDRAAGERGVVSVPDRSQEFRDNVDAVVAIGARLGCDRFNALYGNRSATFSPEEQDQHAIEELAFAAEAAGRIDGVVLVEAVSGADAYPLKTADDAVAVIERVEPHASAVRWLADLYHLAMNGDDVDSAIARHSPRVGHVQIADAPGRHEPGTGQLPLRDWLEALGSHGYSGWIGLEYQPAGLTTDSFDNLP